MFDPVRSIPILSPTPVLSSIPMFPWQPAHQITPSQIIFGPFLRSWMVVCPWSSNINSRLIWWQLAGACDYVYNSILISVFAFVTLGDIMLSRLSWHRFCCTPDDEWQVAVPLHHVHMLLAVKRYRVHCTMLIYGFRAVATLVAWRWKLFLVPRWFISLISADCRLSVALLFVVLWYYLPFAVSPLWSLLCPW